MRTIDFCYRQARPWNWTSDKHVDVYIDGVFEGTHWMKCTKKELIDWLKNKLGVKRIHLREFVVPKNEQAIRLKAHSYTKECMMPWDYEEEYDNDPFLTACSITDIIEGVKYECPECSETDELIAELEGLRRTA